MFRVKRLYPIVILGLLAAGVLVTACGPKAEKLNEKGNEAFAEEAYLEALAAYESALIESPELAEPYYNAANTLYREGAFDEALTLLEEALKYADAETLEQYGFYNTGNSSYNLQEWESAVAAYTEALLRNPDDQDAKYNLELALQQLQQQQEEQEQQEENEDQQDEQSENEDNQDEEQQDQSEAGQDEQDQEQASDSSEGEEDQQENENDQSQDGEGENQEQGPSQVPQPGQRMTAEQARQLLAAIAEDSETLQERLGQIFVVPPNPPTQDW